MKLHGSKTSPVFITLLCSTLNSCAGLIRDDANNQQVGGAVSGTGGNLGFGGVTGNAGNVATAGNTSGGVSAGNGGTSAADACSLDNTFRCTGSAIETCSNKEWQILMPCDPAHCDAAGGRCMVCAPGSNRCDGFNLQTCSPEGDTWGTTYVCETSDLCDSVTGTCRLCLQGDAFCTGASLYQCNARQTGWNVSDCGSPDLCDGQMGKCIQACAPGAYRCNPDSPAELQVCPPSALNWETVDVCITSALCDATAQQCDPVCVPDTYDCNGTNLEHCKADGTGVEVLKTCQDANHCSMQKHDCVACTPGQFQCSGATLQTCGSDQTWTDQENCATSALCDAANGRCTLPICQTPGSYRCQGNIRQQCDVATRTWKDDICASRQVCDLTTTGDCPVTCPAVNTRCNMGGSLATVEKCVAVGNTIQWQYVQTCASSALCDASDAGATCIVPGPVNQYICVGNALQHVSAGDTSWETVAVCASDQICNATSGRCDICVSYSYACDSSNLTQCSSDGQTIDVLEDCGTADHCHTSPDKTTGHCDS